MYNTLSMICTKQYQQGNQLGNVHPIKIECLHFFRDVISLLARVFIFLNDRATQEDPMKNI